jgi:hypothetical protein
MPNNKGYSKLAIRVARIDIPHYDLHLRSKSSGAIFKISRSLSSWIAANISNLRLISLDGISRKSVNLRRAYSGNSLTNKFLAFCASITFLDTYSSDPPNISGINSQIRKPIMGRLELRNIGAIASKIRHRIASPIAIAIHFWQALNVKTFSH